MMRPFSALAGKRRYMFKRFDAKKRRAVFYCMSGYEFPATRVFLVAFFVKLRESCHEKITYLFYHNLIYVS